MLETYESEWTSSIVVKTSEMTMKTMHEALLSSLSNLMALENELCSASAMSTIDHAVEIFTFKTPLTKT